jgi:hypothetical protein
MINQKIICTMLVSLLLSACATAPDIEDMVVGAEAGERLAFHQNLQNKIMVTSVEGGDETNPLWTSEIESEGFKSALVESLKAAGLLSAEENAAGYQLSVKILAVDQPVFGFDMTVSAEVEYKLASMTTGEVVFNETLKSEYTATMDDAFYGPERLKIANEGAVKQNIKMLLEELSVLRF